jgi:hypothetical protein
MKDVIHINDHTRIILCIYIYLVTVTPSDSSKAVKMLLSASIHIIQEAKKEMITVVGQILLSI